MSDDETARQHESSGEPRPDGEDRPRRWWPFVLSGIVMVAVLALTATVLSGVLSGGKDDDAVEIAGSDLPPLDPDKRYTFEDLENGDESEPTATSRAYREAFWGHLEEEFPGYQSHWFVEPEYDDVSDLDDGDPMLGDPVENADLVRTMSGLAEWRTSKDGSSSVFERNTGYKRPYFQLSGTPANNLPDYTQFPGQKYADGLSLNVYPAGSFIPDFPADEETSGVHLMGCDPSDRVECDTATTDDGDKLLMVQEMLLTENDGEQVKYHQTNTVAMVRASDGVGIVVSDESPINRYEVDPNTELLDDPDDATPALSPDDLTELAQALPEKPVE